MTDDTQPAFETFHRQYESPVYQFACSCLAGNLHIHTTRDADGTAYPEPLQDIAADVTVEAFVSLYRIWHLLADDSLQARDWLYKTAAWLCDGP